MIGFLIILALLCAGLASFAVEYSRKQSRSVAEYERDVKLGPGGSTAMLRGAFGELDKVLAPSQAAIAETLETERRRAEADVDGDLLDRIDELRHVR